MLTVSDNHIVLGGGGGGGGGDVVGATSSTDNAIARFDGTTGKLVQNSNVVIADNGSTTISGDANVKLSVTGNTASTADTDIPEILVRNMTVGGTAQSKYMLGGGYLAGNIEMWLASSGYFGESQIRNVSNHPLSLWTNNTKRLTIEANGITFVRAGLRVSGGIYDSTNSAGTDGQVLKKVGGLVIWANP